MNSHKTNVPVRMFLPSTSLRWRVRKSRGREGEEESGVGGREGGREDRFLQRVLSQKHSFYLLIITVLR